MELSEIVPLETIETLLGQQARVDRLRTADRDEILANQPSDLYGIAASTWNRIVWQGPARVDPMRMRSYFQHEDPRLTHAIEKVIGKPMLKEFGFLKATVTHSRKPFVVATSSVAHLFSDELHLYDIALPGSAPSRSGGFDKPRALRYYKRAVIPFDTSSRRTA